MAQPVLGLQLYTVREALAADFVGTIRKVSEAGYDAVEFAGKAPMSNAELKALLDDLNLQCAGAHAPLPELETDLDKWIDFVKEVAVDNLVLPFMPEDRRKSGEDWAKMGGVLDAIGAKARAQGVKFSYHNHSFEFAQFDGKYGLDILYANCSADNVLCELDTYWIKHGGADPVEFLEANIDRIPVIHLKDVADREQRGQFTSVGTGQVPVKAVMTTVDAHGIEYAVVEQDRPHNLSGMESIACSMYNLREMGVC